MQKVVGGARRISLGGKPDCANLSYEKGFAPSKHGKVMHESETCRTYTEENGYTPKSQSHEKQPLRNKPF